MPRRIIYIRNPDEGSHFRTIDGGGGSPRGPRPPRGGGRRPPGRDTDPGGVELPGGGAAVTLPGGNTYKLPPINWFIHGPRQPAAPNYGSLPGYGVGPYQQEWTEFQQPSTVWGDLYLIASGIDPRTGNTLAPYGTPGTLKFGAGTPFMSLTSEQMDAGRIKRNAAFFGATPGKIPKMPSGLTTRAANRNKKRPWWAK